MMQIILKHVFSAGKLQAQLVFLQRPQIPISMNKYCEVSRCKSAPKKRLKCWNGCDHQWSLPKAIHCIWLALQGGSSPSEIHQPRKSSLQALNTSLEAESNSRTIYPDLGEEIISQVKGTLSVTWQLGFVSSRKLCQNKSINLFSTQHCDFNFDWKGKTE